MSELLFRPPEQGDLDTLWQEYCEPDPEREDPDPALASALRELREARELLAVADEMRLAQRAWYQDHRREALARAKQLEREYDRRRRGHA